MGKKRGWREGAMAEIAAAERDARGVANAVNASSGEGLDWTIEGAVGTGGDGGGLAERGEKGVAAGGTGEAVGGGHGSGRSGG
jgi:hypothetical protein